MYILPISKQNQYTQSNNNKMQLDEIQGKSQVQND